MSSPGKKFSVAECDWLGFDLDHTIVRYQQAATGTLIYDGMMQFLADEKSDKYGQEILQHKYDPLFSARGCIFDKTLGNLLKVDASCCIISASHGRHPLSSLQISQAYGDARVIEFSLEEKSRYWPLITFFEVPAAYMLAVLVEYVDKRALAQSTTANYEDLFDDLLAGFSFNFNFFDKGWYFPLLTHSHSISKDLDRYIYRRSNLRRWLESLKAKGKRLFLLTNSRLDYTNLLLTHAFGPDWRDVWDVIVVHAQKGGFFSQKLPFRHVSPENLNETTDLKEEETLQLGGIYGQGNAEQFNTFLASVTAADRKAQGSNEVQRPTVMYFGDHLKTDVHDAATYTHWMPVAIVEEMEAYMCRCLSAHPYPARGKHHKHLKHAASKNLSHVHSHDMSAEISYGDSDEDTGKADAEPQLKKQRLAALGTESKQQHQHYAVLEPSVQWGCFFYGPNQKDESESAPSMSDSKEATPDSGPRRTYWHQYICEYAALAIPDVEYLSTLPMDQSLSFKPGTDECFASAVGDGVIECSECSQFGSGAADAEAAAAAVAGHVKAAKEGNLA